MSHPLPQKGGKRMEARIYQVNANRDFLGFAYKQIDYHRAVLGREGVDASFYDLVYEGHLSEEELELGFYSFNSKDTDRDRHMYISDVIEVISSETVEPGFYYVNGDGYVKISFDASKASPKETIRVVYVEPGKLARIVSIDATNARFEDLVDGMIGNKHLPDPNIRIVYNVHAEDMGMTTNRLVYENDRNVTAISGPFFICKAENNSYESLTPAQRNRYLRMFYHPQHFFRRGNSVVAQAYHPQLLKKSYEQ